MEVYKSMPLLIIWCMFTPLESLVIAAFLVYFLCGQLFAFASRRCTGTCRVLYMAVAAQMCCTRLQQLPADILGTSCVAKDVRSFNSTHYAHSQWKNSVLMWCGVGYVLSVWAMARGSRFLMDNAALQHFQGVGVLLTSRKHDWYSFISLLDFYINLDISYLASNELFHYN